MGAKLGCCPHSSGLIEKQRNDLPWFHTVGENARPSVYAEVVHLTCCCWLGLTFLCAKYPIKRRYNNVVWSDIWHKKSFAIFRIPICMVHWSNDSKTVIKLLWSGSWIDGNVAVYIIGALFGICTVMIVWCGTRPQELILTRVPDMLYWYRHKTLILVTMWLFWLLWDYISYCFCCLVWCPLRNPQTDRALEVVFWYLKWETLRDIMTPPPTSKETAI